MIIFADVSVTDTDIEIALAQLSSRTTTSRGILASGPNIH